MANKVFKLCIFIIVFLMTISKVNAVGTCDYAEIAKLKNIAANISITYSYVYNEKTDDMKFKIELDNIQANIILQINNKIYKYNNNSSMIFDNFDDGQKHTINIYTEATYCLNKTLLTRYIELPKYNKFYNDTICSTLPNYYMCQMWYQHDLSESKFIEKINEYKTQVEEPIEEDKNNDNYSSLVLQVFEFIYANYYYFVAASGIIILIFTAYIMYDNKKDDFDLNSK